MGKRYRCDYCDKHMVATPAIVKTHNRGLVHQKLVNEHYHQFKNPETILNEESNKRPCSRFLQGTCSFGRICRNSHYTREQLDWLREYVASKNQPKEFLPPSFEALYKKLQNDKSNTPNEVNTILYDANGMTHVFPWVYSEKFVGENMPLSIKKFALEDFACAEIVDWG